MCTDDHSNAMVERFAIVLTIYFISFRYFFFFFLLWFDFVCFLIGVILSWLMLLLLSIDENFAKEGISATAAVSEKKGEGETELCVASHFSADENWLWWRDILRLEAHIYPSIHPYLFDMLVQHSIALQWVSLIPPKEEQKKDIQLYKRMLSIWHIANRK